jgi:sulfhydrogenase subunit gamma (sulfur reductase)
MRSLVITNVRDEARATRSFDLMPDDAQEIHGVSFVPGQVAVLKVEDEDPDYFAFASAPDDPELEVLVKHRVGANDHIFDLKPGERVDLVNVVGHGFLLDEQKHKDLVFVAMGTGVAPLRSALRHVIKRKEDFGQLVVLYGARTPDHFCYRDETDGWEDAGVELRQVISRPDGLRDCVKTHSHSPHALAWGSARSRINVQPF